MQNSKSRTPSGTVIENKVQDIRTFFSQGSNQTVQKEPSVNRSERVSSQLSSPRESRFIAHTPKQAQLLNVLKESDTESDTDNTENFATPPATPFRSVRMDTGKEQSHQHLKEDAGRDELQIENSQQPAAVINDITMQLDMMRAEKEKIGEPETMSITAVHAMFKKLEIAINQNTQPRQGKDEQPRPKGNELQLKAMKSAIQHMCDETDELRGRIDKLELNTQKKSIVINGLFTNEEKEYGRRDIDVFLNETLGVKIKIDDYYEIGSAFPRSKVVILHSLRDKLRIMRLKKALKGFKNELGNPFYINDYVAAETNEKRKYSKFLSAINEAQDQDDQVEISDEYGSIKIQGQKFQQKISPPNPAQLVDLTTEQLQKIMEIPICRGPEIEQEGNKFACFSLSVSNFQQIEDAYLKMRLCYPKARHIVCAFNLKYQSESKLEPFYSKGYCDDGEHGAGLKILDILESSAIEQRVVFITRMYSGFKIGGNRFKCMTQALEKCIDLYPHNNILDVNQYIRHDEEIEMPSDHEDQTATKEVDEKDDKLHNIPKGRRSSRGGRVGRGGKMTNNDRREYTNKRRRESSSPEEHGQSNYYKKYAQNEDEEMGYSPKANVRQNSRGSYRGWARGNKRIY